ncbi:MAG: hypothetical protein AAGN35_03760 [Bacteroidota bacterium]
MKRILLTILPLYYLLATLGIGINVHYCGGKVGDVQLFASPESCCDSETEDDCCHEEHVRFQLEDAQSFAQTAFKLHFTAAIIEPINPDVRLIVGDEASFVLATDHPPPQSPDRWRLYCAPLHYG